MITKAIIPVAGWGTRRLPVTKAIEKCMLPVGNRPIVDYVVQDCITAGITDIYFVVGEQSGQLHDFYRNNVELNDYLRRNGKEDLLPLIAPDRIVRQADVARDDCEETGTPREVTGWVRPSACATSGRSKRKTKTERALA